MNTTLKQISNKDCQLIDCHSGLEKARGEIFQAKGQADLQKLVTEAGRSGQKIIAHGGRHAMGGQQMEEKAAMVSLKMMNRLTGLDCRRGLATFQGGTTFKEVIETLAHEQKDKEASNIWCIRQKPTGVDEVSLGGAVASNIHGRGLNLSPLAGDIEKLELLTAGGDLLTASEDENQDLFRRIIGGFGLFGIVTSVTLRLKKRQVLERRVKIVDVEDLITTMQKRMQEGAQYGDFQFAIDHEQDGFLTRGIVSTYHPVPVDAAELPELTRQQAALSPGMWRELIYLAHTNKSEAFRIYSEHYKRTCGQLYLSDRMQLSTYFNGYHKEMKGHNHGSEIITELYVPRNFLTVFLHRAANLLRQRQADVIYGTVRMIEKDRVAALPWATDNFACIVLNLHTEHDRDALRHTAETFQELIDLALALKGNFYLTYHRFARPEQLMRGYPSLPDCLSAKLAYDPQERFHSNFYQYLKLSLETFHQTVH